jgi:hypothetical protein
MGREQDCRGRKKIQYFIGKFADKIRKLVTMKWAFNKYVLNIGAGWNVSHILQLI